MKSLLHILSVTLEILGSFGCIGLILLMKSAYYDAITTVVSGRIVEWVKEETGASRAARYRARLAYRDRNGNEQLVLSTEKTWDTDLPKYPLQEPVVIRYVRASPDWAQLADSFAMRWGIPLAMIAIGALCFTIAFKIGG